MLEDKITKKDNPGGAANMGKEQLLYRTEIEPLVEQLAAKCKELKVEMVNICAVGPHVFGEGHTGKPPEPMLFPILAAKAIAQNGYDLDHFIQKFMELATAHNFSVEDTMTATLLAEAIEARQRGGGVKWR